MTLELPGLGPLEITNEEIEAIKRLRAIAADEQRRDQLPLELAKAAFGGKLTLAAYFMGTCIGQNPRVCALQMAVLHALTTCNEAPISFAE